jgi:predicted dehydrogenase
LAKQNNTNTALPQFSNFPSGADYYLDARSGGNAFTIYFAHFLDSFLHVLGPFASASPADSDPMLAHLSTVFPCTTLVNNETGAPSYNLIKTAPDHIFIHAPLQNGAFASLNWYTTPTPISDEGLRWNIVGTKGEIEVTCKSGWWQTLGAEDVVVKVKRVGTTGNEGGGVEILELKGKEGAISEGLKGKGVNTARTWEAFLEGRREDFADFEDAVATHEVLERIMRRAGW